MSSTKQLTTMTVDVPEELHRRLEKMAATNQEGLDALVVEILWNSTNQSNYKTKEVETFQLAGQNQFSEMAKIDGEDLGLPLFDPKKVQPLPQDWNQTMMIHSFSWKHALVTAPFPYTDSGDYKIRPVLCLSEPVGPYSEILVAFVTSKIPYHQLKTDLTMTKEQSQQVGLPSASAIRLHRITTLNRNQLQGYLGHLPGHLQEEASQKVLFNFL